MRIIFFILIGFQWLSAQWALEELGRFGGLGNEPGQFRHPTALDFSADGRLFVCDQGNNRIQVFDHRGRHLTEIGGFGWQKEQFDAPQDVWARTTINIWVADYNNQRVQRLDKDLNFLGSLESNDGDDERFQFREVLSAAYSGQGDLFLLDNGERKVIKFNPRRNAEQAFAYYESGQGELQEPIQLELTADQHVLISDAGLPGIFEFDYFGTYMRTLQNDSFKRPTGMAIDESGNIWVADPAAKAVFVLDRKGKKLAEINNCGGRQLRHPMDVSVRNETGGRLVAYIIDENEIIIAAVLKNGDKE